MLSDATIHAGPLQVRLAGRAMAGIRDDVVRALASVPKRGAETGGLLTGQRVDGTIWVEGFVPVPCEHRFGPSYRLSEKDLSVLTETAAKQGSRLVGFYRSRIGGAPDASDIEDARRVLPDAVCGLVVAPEGVTAQQASLFLLSGERWIKTPPATFPFQGTLDAPPLSEPAPPPVPTVAPPAVPTVAAPAPDRVLPPLPAPVRRHLTTGPVKPRRRRRRFWPAFAALALIAGIGGAVWLNRSSVPAVPATVATPPASAPAPPTLAQQPPVPQSPPAPAPENTADRAAPQAPAGIQSMLDDWASAIGRADTRTATAFYTSRLSSFNGKRNASRDEVRRNLDYLMGRYGRPVSYRLEGVRISQRRNRATVTLRRIWTTSAQYQGEERTQLALVRSGDEWKIASERRLGLATSRAR